jgi:uncharacterized protein (TIGR02246 family)
LWKYLTTIPLVFLLCFVFGCQRGDVVSEEPAVDFKADAEAIKAWLGQYTSTVRTGDVDSLISLYAEDIVVLPPNGSVVEGRNAFRQWLIAWVGAYNAEETLKIQEIDVFGNHAFARGSHAYRNIHKESGDIKEGNGTFINLFQRQSDGKWKCTHNMWASVPTSLPRDR